MNIFSIIGVITGVIGVIGVIYTIYYGKNSQRKKLLIYENSSSLLLAQAFSPEDDYKLSVVFQRKGATEERIDSVYTTFLKFANLGKEPILGKDIAPTNPIKLMIKDTRTLDIQIAGITRQVNNVNINNQIIGDKESSAELHFDFLDFKDGALVKIITVGNEGKISLSGDIIGMPDGIRNIEGASVNKSINRLGGWLAALGIIASLILSAFIYYWKEDTWDNIWLIFVPVAAIIGMTLFEVIIAATLWPSGKTSFPSSLDLPTWCKPFILQKDSMKAQLLNMKLEEKVEEKEN
jgi:hypothetical protein